LINKKYNVIELFAGAGGLALGLEQAGFTTKIAIEINKWATKTLRTNRPDWNIVQEDITKISENGIKSYLKETKPKMFLAENVKGLSTHDKGKTLQVMLDVFKEVGISIIKYLHKLKEDKNMRDLRV